MKQVLQNRKTGRPLSELIETVLDRHKEAQEDEKI
jgi:hypothetical protein